jgi:hypothetical protein
VLGAGFRGGWGQGVIGTNRLVRNKKQPGKKKSENQTQLRYALDHVSLPYIK